MEQKLTELLGPIVQHMEATEKLSGEIDNFDQLQGEARKFMKANLEVAEAFNAVRVSNPVAAWKYAIRETLIARGQAPANPPGAASLPGGMTPQGRAPVNPAGPEQRTREAEALQYGKDYGDMAPYRAERLKDTSIRQHVMNTLRQLGYLPPDGSTQGW